MWEVGWRKATGGGGGEMEQREMGWDKITGGRRQAGEGEGMLLHRRKGQMQMNCVWNVRAQGRSTQAKSKTCGYNLEMCLQHHSILIYFSEESLLTEWKL